MGSGLEKNQITRNLGRLGYHVKEKKVYVAKKKRVSKFYYHGLEWKDDETVNKVLDKLADKDDDDDKNNNLDSF